MCHIWYYYSVFTNIKSHVRINQSDIIYEAPCVQVHAVQSVFNSETPDDDNI